MTQQLDKLTSKDASGEARASSDFYRMHQEEPFTQAVVAWLRRNGLDPEGLVTGALASLHARGRNLPRDRRIRYATNSLIGEFLVRWAERHRGRLFAEISAGPEGDLESKPFTWALLAINNERTFRRIAPQFIRTSILKRSGLWTGEPDEFKTFVTLKSNELAAVFLKNFDPSRQNATFAAVRYLQKSAVSYYLVRRTRPIRKGAPNLKQYLQSSTRLSQKTVVAVKLAYFPFLLTQAERGVLRGDFGYEGRIDARIPIKTIARFMGYRSAAALSRKLYRVREWCRGEAGEEEGATCEFN